MTTRPLYQALANKIQARLNCEKSNNNEWYHKHKQDADALVDKYMPSGSGIDSGCDIDYDKSTKEKLVFNSSYHTMDENGFYGPWVDFTVTVKPSLINSIDLTITGKFSISFNDAFVSDGDELKDYLYGVFDETLRQEV